MDLRDLLIQAPALPGAAVEAFAAACPAARVTRREGAARLYGVADSADTRRIVTALAAYWECDAALLAPDLHSRSFRLLVMDMDSTLVTIEGIDELARLAGKGAQVAAITEAAMRGQIRDYAQSLRRRVALLKGADAGLAAQVIAERLQLSPGAGGLLDAARVLGWRTLLVSGGFTVFADHVRDQLGIDASWANALHSRDGRYTGEVSGPAQNGGQIVDAAAKARALREHCAALGCTPAQAVAIGDGANDLEMLAAAGLSVAFRAKPVVRERAHIALDHSGLDGLLNAFADRW